MAADGRALLGLMAAAAKDDPAKVQVFALGTITTAVAPGPYVTFDEDTTETQTVLPTLGRFIPGIGDRVILGKINGQWTIIGPVGAGVASSTWTPVPFSAAVGYSDTAFVAPSYLKEQSGFVSFRGLMRSTAVIPTGTVLWTMPVGYRPLKTEVLWAFDNSSTAAPGLERLNLSASGQVTNTLMIGAGNNWSLTQVRYYAEA